MIQRTFRPIPTNEIELYSSGSPPPPPPHCPPPHPPRHPPPIPPTTTRNFVRPPLATAYSSFPLGAVILSNCSFVPHLPTRPFTLPFSIFSFIPWRSPLVFLNSSNRAGIAVACLSESLRQGHCVILSHSRLPPSPPVCLIPDNPSRQVNQLSGA